MITKFVKVKPNAHQNKIVVSDDGAWLIHLTALPVKGEANKQLVAYLSTILKLPKQKINILKGANTKFKKIEIDIEDDNLPLI